MQILHNAYSYSFPLTPQLAARVLTRTGGNGDIGHFFAQAAADFIMAKRRHYNDKFRASAVAMVIAYGYPQTEGALTRVANELKIPRMTLSRWANEANNPPPPELVTEKKEDLATIFEKAAYTYLQHAVLPDVVENTTGQQAMIAAATATDKMRLLRGLPTEIVEVMPRLIDSLKRANLDPKEILERLITRANERAENILQ